MNDYKLTQIGQDIADLRRRAEEMKRAREAHDKAFALTILLFV